MQSELLLSTLAGEHPTVYLSTLRPAAEVADDHDAETAVRHERPEATLADPATAFADLPERGIVVVDPANGLERERHREEYAAWLNALRRRLDETGSVGVLHCLESDPPLRWLTLARADAVWRLHQSVTPLSVETRLVVPKLRGGSPLREPLKLRLAERVSVDTSRDI